MKTNNIASILLAAALGCTTPALAQTTSITLTAEDMRILAQDLLNTGNPHRASAVADALLFRDPTDVAALIFAAQAALDQGQPAASAPFAHRAYRAAGDDVSRYVAARLAARSHATLEQDTRAQIWLRRARQYAPDAANAASVAEDYAFLRDRNPLSVSLSFGASPSSNINNGSRSDTTTIGQFEAVLSESAKALSGIAYTAGVTVLYRLAASDTSATFSEVDLQSTTYSLSTEAKDGLQRDIDAAAANPFPNDNLPRSGSDFAYSQLSVGLINKRILREGLRPSTLSVHAGKSWYGGDPYQTFVTLGAAQTVALGRTEQLRFDASLRQDFSPEEGRNVFSYAASVGYSRMVEAGHLVSVSLSDRISQSDDSERDYRSLRLGVGLDLAEPIANVRYEFAAQIEERKYDASVYAVGVRRDRIVSVQVTALLDEVEYYGFKPAFTARVGRTISEADRFDTQYGNIGFDLRSAF
jgi:hypothetical protein